MQSATNQAPRTSPSWEVRTLQKGTILAAVTILLSACAVYPEPPPSPYDGVACCYSYYDYPAYYPRYYGYGPSVRPGYYGGGYHYWR